MINKALVVDDSKVAHLTLRKMLMERDIEVDWVGSGEESLAYLKQQKPDLVFMDVMMPGMDGFEALKAINQSSEIDKPVIVMCSANATNEDKNIASENGAIDFLSKPYTSHELDTILGRVTETLDRDEAQTVSEPESEREQTTEEMPAQEPLPEPQVSMPAPKPEPALTVAADSISNEEIERIARSAAESVARKTAEVTLHAARNSSRTIAEEAVQKALADYTHAQPDMPEPIDVDALRSDLERSIMQAMEGPELQQQVDSAVAHALESDTVEQQLLAMVNQQSNKLEAKVRDLAHRIVQEQLAAQASDEAAAAAQKKASSAMSMAVLALLIALGAAGFIVAGILGLI